jgi:hypothetical protein
MFRLQISMWGTRSVWRGGSPWGQRGLKQSIIPPSATPLGSEFFFFFFTLGNDSAQGLMCLPWVVKVTL